MKLSLPALLLPCLTAAAQSPAIDSVTPSVGLDQGGTLLTITGTDLDSVQTVSVGGQPLDSFTLVSPNQIEGNAPAGSAGVVDVTVTGTSGSATATAAFGYATSKNVAGYALQFDGINDWVRFGSVAPLGDNTFEAWIRPSSPSLGFVVGHASGPTTACGHGLLLWANTGVLCYDVDPVGCNTANFLCAPGDWSDSWVHFAGTYDGFEQRIYVNGELVDVLTGTTFLPSTYMTVGAQQYFNGLQSFFGGAIDEVRVWNYARTEHQIREAMSLALTGAEAGLVGYWRFDEGSGSTVAPSSPTGPFGDVFGAQWIPSTAPIFEPDLVPTTHYCVSDFDSSGCQALTASSGQASSSSASGFTVTATGIASQRVGTLFFGQGGTQIPYLGGTLCVQPPLRRTSVQGAGGSGACTGSFSTDLNAWNQANPSGLFQEGALLHAQYWYRDVDAASGVAFSDAAAFHVGP